VKKPVRTEPLKFNIVEQICCLLEGFRRCFAHRKAFAWFALAVFGFLIRLDHDGTSSMIRRLGLAPDCYATFLNFFRTASWSLAVVQAQWVAMVLKYCPPVTVAGYPVLVGDGIKVAKEATKMPGVKKLHQESENSGKPEFIFGHHFGIIGLLAGSALEMF